MFIKTFPFLQIHQLMSQVTLPARENSKSVKERRTLTSYTRAQNQSLLICYATGHLVSKWTWCRLTYL